MNFLQDLILTFVAPVGTAIMSISLGNLLHMPFAYLLVIICAPTAAIATLVVMRLRKHLNGSNIQTASKGPKIAISVKPTAASSQPLSKNLPAPKGAIAQTQPQPIKTPVQGQTTQTTAAPKPEPKPVELPPEIKEIRDLLAKMQSQMELMSEIMLSSDAEKNEIRNSSSALKKFKLSTASEEKGASQQGSTEKGPDGAIKHVASKRDEQPFVSKKGVFEEIPKAVTPAAPKPSAKIKIPVSALQEGADESTEEKEKQWRETHPVEASSTSGQGGVSELVQLKNELERIRQRIAPKS